MPWDVRIETTDEVHEGLSKETVRELLSTSVLLPTDWARPAAAWPWQQLATIDNFSDITHRLRRRRGKASAVADEEMDMTPMIDVTFLLLIFFMITAAFTQQKGLDFPPDKIEPPPTPDNPAPGLKELQRDRLVLKIGADDSFRLVDRADDGSLIERPAIAADDLVETLRRVSQRETKHQLLILPDALASHEAMVLAIDASAQAGITSVSIADISSSSAPAPVPTP